MLSWWFQEIVCSVSGGLICLVTAMLVSNSTDVFSGMLSLKVGENNQCDLFNIAFAFLSSSLDLALLSHLNDFPFSFFSLCWFKYCITDIEVHYKMMFKFFLIYLISSLNGTQITLWIFLCWITLSFNLKVNFSPRTWQR